MIGGYCMDNVEVLYDNKWLQLRKKTMPNGFEYIYSHSPWCNGVGVAILGYRTVENGSVEVLGRYEVCPAHGNDLKLCSLTGGADVDGELFAHTARRELLEESGYDIGNITPKSLGYVYSNKSSDSITHLFCVDLTGFERGDSMGDGTLGEEGAYSDWVSMDEALWNNDPLLSTMILRRFFTK